MVALCFVPIPSPIGCSPVESVVFVLCFHRMNTKRWRDSSLQSWNLHSGQATSWGLSVVPKVESESKSEGIGFTEFLSLTVPRSPVGTILWIPWVGDFKPGTLWGSLELTNGRSVRIPPHFSHCTPSNAIFSWCWIRIPHKVSFGG